MLPRPDWKYEDQRGAREPVHSTALKMANKVGICLVGCSMRSPTERKLRIETQRRSQPYSRRMITVLHKMSKSNRTPGKENVLLDEF